MKSGDYTWTASPALGWIRMLKLRSLFNRHRNARWALADQSVVSGANFVTGILLARFLGPEMFGLYVLLQAVLLYVNSFQGALIFQPMMSAAPQFADDERQQYLRGVFSLQILLTLSLAGISAILALFADSLFGFAGLHISIVIALTAALIGFQLQDWQRRYYFVEERAHLAFFNDIISYGGQVSLLLIASFSGHLTVANAFWIVAVSTFIAFLVGFISSRLRPLASQVRAVLRDGWRAGRDYLAAWQFQLLGTQGVYMIGAGIVGTTAVGGVRATQGLIGPINILFQAMENLVPIKAARKYSTENMPGLMRFMRRTTLLGTLMLVPILLLLCFFAHPLIHTLYGDQYLAFVSLVYWQAAYVFIQFYQRQAFFFLRTVQATGIVLRSGIITAAVALTVAALTVPSLQETGLMLALLSGTGAALIYSLIASRKTARQLHAESCAETDATSPNIVSQSS